MNKIIILVFVMSFVSCSLLQRGGDGSGGGKRNVASSQSEKQNDLECLKLQYGDLYYLVRKYQDASGAVAHLDLFGVFTKREFCINAPLSSWFNDKELVELDGPVVVSSIFLEGESGERYFVDQVSGSGGVPKRLFFKK